MMEKTSNYHAENTFLFGVYYTADLLVKHGKTIENVGVFFSFMFLMGKSSTVREFGKRKQRMVSTEVRYPK